MTHYTLPLALEDFLPVIFSSVGLFLIGQMVKRANSSLGQMAIIGWLLITIGGLLKAGWKLIMAATKMQTNLVWLDKGLFIWMAAGFTLVACAVWFVREVGDGQKQPQRLWLPPTVVLGLSLIAMLLTGFPDVTINIWRFILLGVMTIGNVVLVILLIQQARQQKMNLVAILFLANIVIVFILSGMARMPNQTVGLQWAEQLLNTFAQGSFAYASWQLAKITPYVSS